MKNHTFGLRRPLAVRAVLIASASLAAVVSLSTQAAVVDSGPVSIAIPATTDGLYLNVVTGVSSGVAASAPGWDFNPWGSTTRNFFWPSAPANTFGGDATGGTVYRLLTPGAIVGPASTFIATASAAAAINFNTGTPGDKIIGFRFNNEAGGTLHYGYAVLRSADADGVPGTIIRYVFESTPNTPITITGGGQPPLTSTPATGTTLTFPPRTVGGPATTSSVTFNNPGTVAATVTCAISGAGAADFSSTGLTPSVPAAGSASVPLSYTSATASTSTATLTCTAGAQTFTFPLTGTTSPAAVPLTSTPPTGSTVTLPPRTVGGPASTGSVTFNNPGTTAATVTCAISGAGAAAFSSTGLTPSVPAAGSASVPLSYTSATAGTSTATLTCTSGAQTFTFTLSGTTGAVAPAAVSVSVFHGKGLLVMLALVFGFGLVTLLVRRN
jgi:hypothetical protein